MTIRRVRSLEELTDDYFDLLELIMGIRTDIGEQGDGHRVIPLFSRLEKLEAEFHKRQT